MKRKTFLPLLIIITCLLLVLNTVPGSGRGAPVGVRITGETLDRLQISGIPFEVLIDYGAFLWGVLPAGDLPQLDQLNLTTRVFDSPFTHTLDHSLVTPAQFTRDMQATETSQAGLYLVQFQGPTRDEWLDALAGDGLEILQYLHPFTYVVWGRPADLQKSLSLPFVRRAGGYQPAVSIPPEPRSSTATPLLARVITFKGGSLAALQSGLGALGAEWIAQAAASDPAFNAITIKIPADRLAEAAALPGVYALQPLPLDGGDRGEMGNQVNAGNLDGSGLAYPGYLDWLRGLGLSGAGVTIANVDSGIDGAHPDLVNRMLPCSGITCGGPAYSDHGTHTAGIMAGDGASGVTDAFGFLRGLGMAPGARLVEQVYNPTYTLPNGMLTLMQESSQNGAVISGNSWGPSDDPQGYDYDTRLVDIGVRDADPDTPGNQPLTYVLSIMNGRGGTSTQGTPDEAKNILTVGSTYLQKADGTQDNRINDLSANSAHGPAKDGRHIPHLVAPGYYVDSTTAGASHALWGGTSMASPAVTGAVALFFETYRNQIGVDPSPALVKAAFLTVAHDLAGHLDADGFVMGHPFDSKQGWGRLNAGAVLDPPGRVIYYDQQTILEETGAAWSTTITTTVDFAELRAMLVWTDAPGHGLGGSAPAWVNDLDLSVTVGGQTYFGNQFGLDGYSTPGGTPDSMNNTEGILLKDLPPGAVSFTVTAASINGDGLPNHGDATDQDFALVIYINVSEVNHQYNLPIFYR